MRSWFCGLEISVSSHMGEREPVTASLIQCHCIGLKQEIPSFGCKKLDKSDVEVVVWP